MDKRVKILINGRVQGVTYRINTKKIALDNEIMGWVRNNNDGTVSILAEGDNTNLEKLISWCKNGPSFAEVENIKVRWEEYIGDLKQFDIL